MKNIFIIRMNTIRLKINVKMSFAFSESVLLNRLCYTLTYFYRIFYVIIRQKKKFSWFKDEVPISNYLLLCFLLPGFFIRKSAFVDSCYPCFCNIQRHDDRTNSLCWPLIRTKFLQIFSKCRFCFTTNERK